MKAKALLIAGLLLLGAKAFCAVDQRTYNVVGATNTTDQVATNIYDSGELTRIVFTVANSATSDVAVVDHDGTVLVSTNKLIGSWTWTTNSPVSFVNPTIKTGNAIPTNAPVNVSVSITDKK